MSETSRSIRAFFSGLRGALPPSSHPPEHLAINRVSYKPDIPLVVLVPGYLYPHRPMMEKMGKRFAQAGFTCDLLLDVVYKRHPYSVQHDLIISHLEAHRQELEKVPAVVFVGHSVGGLHAYEAAVWLANSAWYKGKVIALPLGAPFRQRHLFQQAVFLLMQLTNGGATALLQPSVERHHLPNPRVRALCIAAKRDNIVDPTRAAMYRGETLLVDAKHLGLIFDERVFHSLLRTVRAFMGQQTDVAAL